jgi:hypothetical protein
VSDHAPSTSALPGLTVSCWNVQLSGSCSLPWKNQRSWSPLPSGSVESRGDVAYVCQSVRAGRAT